MKKKLAVITGAASGIGLALAKACLLEDMDIVMADINETLLEQQVKRLQVTAQTAILGVPCDVSSEEAVKQLAQQTFERFKRVDLLINNAGISGHLAPIWELSSAHVRHVIDVNLYGVLHGVQRFLPLMLEQTHPSHICNLSSFYGLCSGSQMAAYAMSKHAIVALTESLYFDLRRLNKPITISVVCPSFTDTQLIHHSAPNSPNGLHHAVGHLMSRSRSAEEVAECILRDIKNKIFYILPDKEVKHECEQRTAAIIGQTLPYEHNLEMILTALTKRH